MRFYGHCMEENGFDVIRDFRMGKWEIAVSEPYKNYKGEPKITVLVGDDFGGDYVHWWLFKDSDGIQKQHINYTQASDAYMPPPYICRKIAEVFQRTAEKYGILEG